VLDCPNIAAQDDPLRIKQLPKGSAGSLIIEREQKRKKSFGPR
jgi:hypothetical protein